MKLITHLLCFCMILDAATVLAQSQTIIPYGSNWKYYDLGNQPPSQSGKKWYHSAYNASGWESGPAHLGYGDDDEATPLDSNALTIYLRRSFYIADASQWYNLKVQLIHDDGAVVYLNGTEIRRVNMPLTITPTYNSFSAGEVGDNALAIFGIADTLVDGNNVLAIEMHQRHAGSSDLSFDLELMAQFDPSGGGANNTSPEIVRGPYLQKLTHHSAAVKWRTEGTVSTLLRYGTQPFHLDQSVSMVGTSMDHEVQLMGLSPNTTYYYQIEGATSTNVDLSEDLFFHTHPEPGTPELLRAWILGDCGTGNSSQRAVRDAFYDYNDHQLLDMILLLGDNAYPNGKDDEYQEALFENMYEEMLKNTTAWSCFGNHDSDSAESNNQTGVYYDIFTFPTAGEAGGIPSGTEAYYSFDYGNVHFIVLDSEGSDRGKYEPMYDWCKSDIQNTLADWIIALWHHPPYSKGSHDSDESSKLVEMRENFLPLLEDNGVDLVLAGHSHSYERSYLLNGHYDLSTTFDSTMHTVGTNGIGDGRKNGNGAYQKEISGPAAGEGAVYVVSGSAGKKSSGDFDHPAIYFAKKERGSCLLEIEGQELNLTFVNEDGEVDDFFTLKKNLPTPHAGGSEACDNTTITPEPGSVVVSGLDGAPVASIEVFEAGWQPVFSCFEDCGDASRSISVGEGTYYVHVKYFTEEHEWICMTSETVEVTESSPVGNCNIVFTSDDYSISVEGLNTPNKIVKLFDDSWDALFYCSVDCGADPEIDNLDEGAYYLHAVGYDESWTPLCAHSGYAVVGNGSNLAAYQPNDHLFLAAAKQGTTTLLSWVTNTDYKNEYFDMEHSTDGLYFRAIGREDSQSQSTDHRNYAGQDTTPQPGANLYRIRQVFIDGSFRYSNTVMVTFDPGLPANVVYPNPASQIAYLHLTEFAGKAATVQLVDGLGETVWGRQWNALPLEPVVLDLLGFSAGLYSVVIEVEEKRRLFFKLVVVGE